ncbi:hypothetical protein COU91_00060 [Candidatus Saccharibacteria bacterium CG10_big_fil_rev_8_21_14_0_10_47_8]|nr:MAG: hypothetical protein COU91_00060 [Candidatus Saccharibacteria bacterium CG10_big_fil_rev_8_21_14_0_10_47_8]
MIKELKVYVAGKVRKDSSFGTHHWRDDFLTKLEELSGIKLENLDPVKNGDHYKNPEYIFGLSVHLISRADVVIVYLTDDISVGGSQEILIGKYFKKPVVGLAPIGGKFNMATREYMGKTIKNFKDPFVFTTCDVVCSDIQGVARTLKSLDKIKPKDLTIIDKLAAKARLKE